MAAVLELGWPVLVGMAVTLTVMLLAPLGFKRLMKKLFERNISYFASFFVVLGVLMVLSLADSQFHLLSSVDRRIAVWWVEAHTARPAAAPEAHAH